uniref:uncharacterized protein LOC109967248 n=1 Tax=Monopterus albus TaxID=43700 RepID=UPI0009B4BBD7|nr:uncharacterized protein LOC109967248 [Monopterus albus]
MSQHEDGQGRGPPSKTGLREDRESRSTAQRMQQQRPDSPDSSCVSMKSDWSEGRLINFKDGRPGDGRVQQQSSEDHSDQSAQQHQPDLDSVLHAAVFRPAAFRPTQESHVGLDQFHFTVHFLILFQLLEENMVTFVKNELKKIQRVLSPDYPECLESQREDEEELGGEDEEQRRRSRESFLQITVNFLRRMKQEELAERLQSSKRV